MTKDPEKWKEILRLIGEGRTDEQIEELTGRKVQTIRNIRKDQEGYQKRIADAENPRNWPYKERFAMEWTKAVNRLRAAAGMPLLEEYKKEDGKDDAGIIFNTGDGNPAP